jgi:hypothetical protein
MSDERKEKTDTPRNIPRPIGQQDERHPDDKSEPTKRSDDD